VERRGRFLFDFNTELCYDTGMKGNRLSPEERKGQCADCGADIGESSP